MICLTFDVEERFHSHLTAADGAREWRASDRIARIVDLVEAGGGGATFFVVGELAERYPELVRRMSDAGFEVASHSYGHLKMDAANRRACEEDIRRSKEVLEQITGRPVRGFRAPSWTARLTDDWLWDHLVDLGFRYDSSLFPFRTHLYGSSENPLEPFGLRPGLREIPPSVAGFGPLRVPYGGGFYLRLYPMWITRWLFGRELGRGRAPIVYLHPWELDRQEGGAMESGSLHRFIGNFGVDQAWGRLEELVRRYEMSSMAELWKRLELQGT